MSPVRQLGIGAGLNPQRADHLAVVPTPPLGHYLRTLFLVDLENLLGGPPARVPTDAWSAAAADLRATVPQWPGDQVVVAVNPRWAMKTLGLFDGALLRCRRGLDGADLALIDETVDTMHVASRFERVLIASGDGVFTEHVTRLINAGLRVENAARPRRCATTLRLAVHETRWLPPRRWDSDAA